MAKPLKLAKDGSLALSEADIARQVIDFMRSKGWYCLRIQSGLVQRPGGKARIRLSEPGTPDWICLKPDYDGSIECLFIEMKRSGGRLRKGQEAWHSIMRKRGFTILVVDSVDNFLKWYAQSFYGEPQKYLQAYLDEYSYRYNRRDQGNLIFKSILGEVSKRAED